MKSTRIFFSLIGFLLAACPLAGEVIDFEILISNDEPHITPVTPDNIQMGRIRAMQADGTVDDMGIFREELYSEDNWQADNQADAKSFVFTLRTLDPYEYLRINSLSVSMLRRDGGSSTVGGITINGGVVHAVPLPLETYVDIDETFPQMALKKSAEIRIQAWDPDEDGGRVLIAFLSGTAEVVRVPVPATSSINATDRFAHSPNTGWINLNPGAEDGVVTGEYFLSGHAWGANTGWINFGNGMPENGWRYANDTSEDFGVNVDDLGRLSGYAWGANIGWINFDWASHFDENRPRIDLVTGEFKGWAYAANIGWIQLGTGHLKTDALDMLDSQGDGLPDAWKYRYFGTLDLAGADTDFTGDGFTDVQHYLAGTNPLQEAVTLGITDFSVGKNPQTDEDEVQISFTTSTRRLYIPQLTQDLRDPDAWEGFGNYIHPEPGGVTTQTYPLQEIPEQLHMRVRAKRPLAP